MIELRQGTKEALADILNVFPEVRWDRLTGTMERFTIFGWIERRDLRSDFATILVEPYEDDGGGFTYQLATSSSELSEEFCRRLQEYNEGEEAAESEHNPCQRVEDVFGNLVPGAVVIAADPMEAGGDIAGPDDPHGRDSAVLSLDRAVMVDGIAVAAMQIERGGQLEELAIGVLLEGDINRSEPREHARVLNIMGLPELAGLICELQAVAHRYSPGLAAELTRLMTKRWGKLEAEGLTRP
jgi:hypothetical protein